MGIADDGEGKGGPFTRRDDHGIVNGLEVSVGGDIAEQGAWHRVGEISTFFYKTKHGKKVWETRYVPIKTEFRFTEESTKKGAWLVVALFIFSSTLSLNAFIAKRPYLDEVDFFDITENISTCRALLSQKFVV